MTAAAPTYQCLEAIRQRIQERARAAAEEAEAAVELGDEEPGPQAPSRPPRPSCPNCYTLAAEESTARRATEASDADAAHLADLIETIVDRCQGSKAPLAVSLLETIEGHLNKRRTR